MFALTGLRFMARSGITVPQEIVNRISIAVIAIGIIAGVALRIPRLGTVPLGLHPDEAVEGYDAYSILKTGRDHRGAFLPLAMQSFNDYRMPLFQYSLVPLVAAFGLKTSVIRFGAALWGILDLLAVTAIAVLTLGLAGAAAASFLYALSPWHLAFSRQAIETSAASATVSLAVLGFFLWLKYRKGRWLIASAIFFGLSLYTYSITKAFTPLAVVVLAFLYRRELRAARKQALLAAAVVMIFAGPQMAILMSPTSDVGGRFAHLSIWSYRCPTCTPPTTLQKLENIGASFASYFTPSFLFIDGDRGDHWTLAHPPGFGQLFPEQAALIAMALTPLLGWPKRNIPDARTRRARKKAPANSRTQDLESRGRRDFAVFLIAWLTIAALPAVAIVPLGAYDPEPGATAPTAAILMDRSLTNAPLTPRLLLSHPDSRHAVLQMAPWTLISALGFVMLLELGWASHTIRRIAAGLLLVGIGFHGAQFIRSYFTDYPVIAAPYFQYGMENVVHAVQSNSDPGQPIIITQLINQPYIYVLFYQRYSPAEFQRLPRWQFNEVSGPVVRFDRYLFVSPEFAYSRLDHGTFVFAAAEQLPVSGGFQIRYPDGRLAYTLIRK